MTINLRVANISKELIQLLSQRLEDSDKQAKTIIQALENNELLLASTLTKVCKTKDIIRELTDLVFNYEGPTNDFKNNPVVRLLRCLLICTTGKRHHYERICQYMNCDNPKKIYIGLKLIKMLAKNVSLEVPSYFFFASDEAEISISSANNEFIGFPHVS